MQRHLWRAARVILSSEAMQFVFTKEAYKQWRKLDPASQNDIRTKIEEVKTKPDLFAKNIKRVFEMEPITHRLRIGNYRLLLQSDFESNKHLVLKVGHRRDVYR